MYKLIRDNILSLLFLRLAWSMKKEGVGERLLKRYSKYTVGELWGQRREDWKGHF